MGMSGRIWGSDESLWKALGNLESYGGVCEAVEKYGVFKRLYNTMESGVYRRHL